MRLSADSSLAEPLWLPLRELRRSALPPGLAGWLLDQGSLTRALQRACGAGFGVCLRGQGRARPLPSERRLLGAPPRGAALLREVELRCGETPVVFARTLIPARSQRGAARRLVRLRDRPLGAVLFADPRTRRLAVEGARLEPGQRLYEAACAALPESARPVAIWGRRTLFSYAGQPLLVNEIFLPTIAEL